MVEAYHGIKKPATRQTVADSTGRDGGESGAHAIDTAAVSESCLWPHADDLALPGATAQYLFVCVVVAGADLCIITLRIL